jgi:hypothetical protein
MSAQNPDQAARRGALVLALLACAGVFVLFFALGRTLSPGDAPREVAPSPVTTLAAGSDVPVHLAQAPAIELAAPVVHKAPPPASATPEESTLPTLSQLGAPASTETATPADTESASPPSTPTTSHSSHGSGGGQSFDSSG